MLICFDHTARSIDVIVVHYSDRATITKFVTEIDTAAFEFLKPVINSRLGWCFIAKSSSKPNVALLSCQITFNIVEKYTTRNPEEDREQLNREQIPCASICDALMRLSARAAHCTGAPAPRRRPAAARAIATGLRDELWPRLCIAIDLSRGRLRERYNDVDT
ncbi:hypothetical protein EVAR_86006_1 [Eumeta japonica]|uniref:Uncharacterized protein n=1 Tax=Eumeta variegata TaxID=151549 RepID=A0A4C1UKU4_EUMVA|nr:hypothetical protein EVAR_86006_1 [Eumeta japonica]